MKKLILLIPALCIIFAAYGQGEGFELFPDAENNEIEVFYNGMHFTSYKYSDNLKKPVLYPLYNSNGTAVTRGFPLNPNPGERVDHPHHVGLWFSFGDVNGIDFWNNSEIIPAEKKSQYGTILHREIKDMTTDSESVTLIVTSDWNDYTGKTLLKAETEYIFGADGHFRTIEHTVTLTAQEEPVVFSDSKEGLFGMRLDKVFEEISNIPATRIGMDGEQMNTPTIDNEGVNGIYRNSHGQEREAQTWGKPAEWVTASAHKEGDDVSVTILDHKNNLGFPAHWHSRGYGLFAANNMGSQKFHESEPAFSYTLNQGQSVTFKHKVIIKGGSFSTDNEINAEFQKFNK